MQPSGKGSCEGSRKIKVTQKTNTCLTARYWCYDYRLFSVVDDNLRRGMRGVQLRVALFRGRCCLIVACFLRFLSSEPPCWGFAQGALSVDRGWLVSRGWLLLAHGEREVYWWSLLLIIW